MHMYNFKGYGFVKYAHTYGISNYRILIFIEYTDEERMLEHHILCITNG